MIKNDELRRCQLQDSLNVSSHTSRSMLHCRLAFHSFLNHHETEGVIV